MPAEGRLAKSEEGACKQSGMSVCPAAGLPGLETLLRTTVAPMSLCRGRLFSAGASEAAKKASWKSFSVRHVRVAWLALCPDCARQSCWANVEQRSCWANVEQHSHSGAEQPLTAKECVARANEDRVHQAPGLLQRPTLWVQDHYGLPRWTATAQPCVGSGTRSTAHRLFAAPLNVLPGALLRASTVWVQDEFLSTVWDRADPATLGGLAAVDEQAPAPAQPGPAPPPEGATASHPDYRCLAYKQTFKAAVSLPTQMHGLPAS